MYYTLSMNVHVFQHENADDKNLDALLLLFRQSLKESDYMASGEIDDMNTLKRVLSNKNLIHFFGYVGDVPIAYCQVIYKADSINFKSGAKINAIAVHPEKRGQGLGKTLLQKVLAELQNNINIKNIYLDVVKNNIVAVNLYKELGFNKVGELKSIFTKDTMVMDIEIYSILVNQ